MVIVRILHYLLITGAAALGVSGLANGFGEGYAPPEFGALIPTLMIGLILWKAIRAPSKKVGVHYFLWAAVMALLMRSVFPSSELEKVYTALMVTCVVLPAIVRPGGAWVAVFLVTALLYGAQVAVEGRVWVEDPTRDSAWYMGAVEFACFSLIGGLVPWWVLSRRAQAQEQEFNRTLEEVRNNAITDAMARTRSKAAQDNKKKPAEPAASSALPTSALSTSALSTSALAAGTIRLDGGASSSDTFALLNGEEVNVQLKAMLFFMRYNFKGLTASAFIYEPSKRVLVLNCYDTKTGVQIKDELKIPFGLGVIGQVASENRLFMSGDLSLYQSGEYNYYVQDEGVASIIAVPIAAEGSNEVLGVLTVDSTNKNAFTEHDKELMRRFSIIAAALIVNIRMSLSLEQSAKTFRVFYEVSHNFSIALKMEEIFNVLMGMVPKIIPSCGRLIVVQHDQGKNTLRLHMIAGNKGELSEGMEFSPASGGIYSYAFNKTTPVNIPDLQAQRSYRFVREEAPCQSTRSLLVIPIIGGEDRKCIGLFSVESGAPSLFRPEIEQILTTIIENASVAITRSLLYLKMEKLATTDGLTGLNNHRTFQEIVARELERAKRYSRPLSLLLTDIDHFKSFNDTYGHPVGDLVLREIAGCIRSSLRVNDFPARYGGEEFAVVLPETDEQGAMITAEKIRQTVENRVIDSGPNKLRVTISIGCVTYPTYGTTQQEIIDCSDKALYASKKGGRNRVTMYNPSMTVASK